MTRENAPTPSGCHWCGVGARDHMQRWNDIVGWHTWQSPTNDQIKDRMQQRRTTREITR